MVIGNAGGALTHKYYVEINGVRNDKLNFASRSKVNLPDIIRSETLPIYQEFIRREAFSFFAKVTDPIDNKEKHIKHWATVEHNAKSETIDLVFGKARESFTNKPFDDTSIFPITLQDPESGIKALFDWDDEMEKFCLDLNGEAFEGLLYLDPTYSADEDVAVSFGCKIKMNGK